MLNAIELNRLAETEMKQLLDGTHQTFAWVKKHGGDLPNRREVENALSDTSLDVKHKVKLAIPIIPMVLDYEVEIELGSGFNLGEVWYSLKKRLWS